MFITSIMFLVSCKKDDVTMQEPIVGCLCNDGVTVPYKGSGSCGLYTETTNGVSVTLTRGGIQSYIRSNKTFCELYPNTIFCLGRNY